MFQKTVAAADAVTGSEIVLTERIIKTSDLVAANLGGMII